jgi:hypothetical protein
MKKFLLLLFPVIAFGASEPIMLDTKTHKFISPLTVDFAGVTVLNFPGGGAVTSVFGRTGAVVATTGDYTASQLAALSGTSKLLGSSASSSSVGEISLGTNLSMSGSTLNASGGGGTIGGSIASPQVAFGTAANTIGGNSNMTWDNTNFIFELGGNVGLKSNASGVFEINNGTSGQWGSLKAGVRDTIVNASSVGLTLGHQHSSGTPTTSMGTGLQFNIDDSTTADQQAAVISANWSNATHGSQSANLDFNAVFNASPNTRMRLTGAGGLNVGNGQISQASSAGVVNLASITFANSVGTSGAVAMSDGSSGFVPSAYTFPSTMTGGSGKLFQDNGTNAVLSAFTMASPGTSGNVLTSNGTNWLSSAPSGGGVPAGANTQVQWNNSGAFGADSGFTYTAGAGIVGLTAGSTGPRINFENTSGGYEAGMAFYNNTATYVGGLVWDAGNASDQALTIQNYVPSAVYYFGGSNLRVANGITIGFTIGTANGATDTGISRSFAGQVEINNGTVGSYTDIKVRTVIHNGYTVATLPAAVAGMVAYVTDGTAALAWGATVTGGGSTKYLVWYNGTNWTVAGK